MTSPAAIEPNHRILVVDDNRAIHEDLRKILIGEVATQATLQSDEAVLFDTPPVSLTHFEIDSAYQGQEGLAKLEQSLAEGRPYALAFVDVRMPPGWDGVETITRLWQREPNLQVVICTAYSDYSWRDIQRRLGHSDNLLVLKKPFDNIEAIQLAYALTRKWLVSRQAQVRLADLDLMVSQRTAELLSANQRLQQEYEVRAAAEEAFRTVFQASPIGITLADMNGRYVDVNAAIVELHGIPKQDIIGRDAAELGWVEGYEFFDTVRRTMAENGGVDSLEIAYVNARLGRRTGLVWIRPVVIGGLPYSLTFFHDITERKRMEEDLRHARQVAEAATEAKADFLASMSHEIRTPLNGVLGLSACLEDEAMSDSLRSTARLIRTSGEMLQRVVSDVLDFSKIESGRLELEHEPFVLGDCLNWSLDLFRQAAVEKNLELRLRVDPRVPARLLGDATRVQQVVANLISNAVKFTHHGSIEMAAELVEEELPNGACKVRIEVSDTGIGVPHEKIDRLFQTFSQVDASTNRRYGGTGLGLAICKRLVEMMGGEIRVESRAGEGTKFEFTLVADVAREGQPVAAQPQVFAPERARILVAEDNKVNQLVAQRMLERMGCTVDVAQDGEEALQSVGRSRYDLLLMDVHMPVMDGLEAARRIRRLPAGQAEVPIVALTASATKEDRDSCLAAGMNDYLTKPLSLDALRAALERWSQHDNR